MCFPKCYKIPTISQVYNIIINTAEKSSLVPLLNIAFQNTAEESSSIPFIFINIIKMRMVAVKIARRLLLYSHKSSSLFVYGAMVCKVALKLSFT